LRLAVGRAPHYKTLVPGSVHLGYRRRRNDQPGKWLVRHYVGGERYRVTPLGLADDFASGDGYLTFAEAQRRALAHRATAARGTVASAIADYVAWLKAHKATGADAERRAVKLILPQLGAVKLSELTTAKINSWLDKLATTPALVRSATTQRYKRTLDPRARRATANRTWTILRAALNRAFAAGLIDSDIAWRRVKAFPGVDAARLGFLTVDEAQRLINAASGEFRTLVQAALLTGARYSELAALRVRDVAHGKIAIVRSKSGKPRHIVLNEEGVAFFAALTIGRAPDDLLLGEWRHSSQARPMRLACKAARIKPISFHALRHTWASLAVMGGMPLMVVAQNLGHAGTRMVEKHYGHLAESYIDAAIRDHAPRYGIVSPNKVRRLR
jgi:integrase